MNLPFYIAKRYLVAKKSQNAINIISWISVFSVAIGTFALVVVLSAFNGLEKLVESLFESFDADVRVVDDVVRDDGVCGLLLFPY